LLGLPTIRSYGEIPQFIQDNKFYIDLENRALFLTVTNQRWLALRLDCLGACLVFFVGYDLHFSKLTLTYLLQIAVFSVTGVGNISAAQIGLVLTYASKYPYNLTIFSYL
jgi:hypothetical protein